MRKFLTLICVSLIVLGVTLPCVMAADTQHTFKTVSYNDLVQSLTNVSDDPNSSNYVSFWFTFKDLTADYLLMPVCSTNNDNYFIG